MIVYEHPLNETIRLCLRLEYLFKQLDYYIERESGWDTRVALHALLEILGVIERPDLKNKLAQILNQYVSFFSHLGKSADIDKKALANTLEQLHKAINEVHTSPGKIGQELRENEFLIPIQQRMTTPAGTCAFSAPAYYLWLHQPSALRLKTLSLWLDSFLPLQGVIDLILQLTRASAQIETQVAKSGFYQTNLDPNISYQMISIGLAVKEKLYPEISVGRYRLTVHFFELNTRDRAHQTAYDVSFKLSCCRI
jgi:cell division protein ZapD